MTGDERTKMMLDYRLHYAVMAALDRSRELRDRTLVYVAKDSERIHRLPEIDRSRRRLLLLRLPSRA